MAETATPSAEHVDKITLKVLIEKKKNKVLFAEAGNDFVDALLSFLTLPLGTIVRLVAKESNIPPIKLGSLSSLYESASQLEEKYLQTEMCKEMLLQPTNSMEYYCQKLKLNIDDTESTKYFLCRNLVCRLANIGRLLSIFRNQRCSCGSLMHKVVYMSPENLTLENGFVMETATFIVCDDLSVFPDVLGTSVDLIRKLGIKNMDAIEEKTVHISKREVVDLLKLSLISKTPLTDVILKKTLPVDNFNPINQSWLEIGEESSDEGRRMVVKVLVRKSNKKILFAVAEKDFADLLFSFLTMPLGGVLHMLEGCSSLSCIDKLYKSISELSPDRYFRSEGLKEKIANAKCAPQVTLGNQILPIGESCLPVYYYHTFCTEKKSLVFSAPKLNFHIVENVYQLNIVDLKSSVGDSSYGGFVKGPPMYMVTDDLVVTPMSSISGLSYLKRLEVPLSDLEERVINIGVKEGLSILKASLTSTFALTNGLKQFITPAKQEKSDRGNNELLKRSGWNCWSLP